MNIVGENTVGDNAVGKLICPVCRAPIKKEDVRLYNLDAQDECEDGRFGPETCTVEIVCHVCQTALFREDGKEFDGDQHL
jgi:uncharacterized Zn finger protein (UPF0148 family)